MQPESTVDGADYVGSDQWFRDQDEQQKRAIEGVPLSGPLAVNFAPQQRSHRFQPTPGSLEWQRIADERRRYQVMLNGRRPTAEERAEHESNLKTIREAHQAV